MLHRFGSVKFSINTKLGRTYNELPTNNITYHTLCIIQSILSHATFLGFFNIIIISPYNSKTSFIVFVSISLNTKIFNSSFQEITLGIINRKNIISEYIHHQPPIKSCHVFMAESVQKFEWHHLNLR